MRFNEHQLVVLSGGPYVVEDRLNYKKVPLGGSSNGKSSVLKEYLFRLRANMLFYFKLNGLGQLDNEQRSKQLAGVFILENSFADYEADDELPFAFSISFNDDPDKKHVFGAWSDGVVEKWVVTINTSRCDDLRRQMVILDSEIKKKKREIEAQSKKTELPAYSNAKTNGKPWISAHYKKVNDTCQVSSDLIQLN